MLDKDEMRQMTERLLPEYRDALQRSGMSKENVDWAVSVLWTGAETPRIQSIEEYERACIAYEAWGKTVTKDNLRSPTNAQMYCLGGEIARFEEEHEREHGRLP